MGRSFYNYLILLSFLQILWGCGGYVTRPDGQRIGLASDEFRDYVEAVFRLQNRLTDELAFAIEDNRESDQGLVEAEARLLDACSGVNELALAARDGQQLPVGRKLALARTVPDCEAAANRATAMLGPSSGP